MDTSQFKQLFNPLPGSHYMQVAVTPDETTEALYEMVKSVDGEISLSIFSNEKVNYSTQFAQAKIKYIDNFKEAFRALPRSNDIIVIKDVFARHENQDMMLKIAYASLANTAELIIIEKKGVMDIESMKMYLQDNEFRAANEIDILDGYDLIIAKKMHMWGNGL